LTDQQRMTSVPPEEWSDEVYELFDMVGEPGRSYNFTHWFVNHPELAKNWLVYNRFLARGKLSPRLREIVVLRIAHLHQSEYEWVEHVKIGKHIGLDDSHFAAVQVGAEHPIWSNTERCCLRAAEQLLQSNDIDDATWQQLAAVLDKKELMELIFLIGTYTLMAWVLKVFRMPIEKINNQ
jgi:4-carboxymuconolactone decarboxylase